MRTFRCKGWNKHIDLLHDIPTNGFTPSSGSRLRLAATGKSWPSPLLQAHAAIEDLGAVGTHISFFRYSSLTSQLVAVCRYQSVRHPTHSICTNRSKTFGVIIYLFFKLAFLGSFVPVIPPIFPVIIISLTPYLAARRLPRWLASRQRHHQPRFPRVPSALPPLPASGGFRNGKHASRTGHRRQPRFLCAEHASSTVRPWAAYAALAWCC